MRNERSLLYYWDVLVRRHLLLAGVFCGVTALVFFASSRQRPQYQASASLLVSQEGSATDPVSLFSSATGLGKRPVLVNHLEILRSYAIAKMVHDTLPEDVGRQVQASAPRDPALFLQRSLSVRPVRDADIIRLSVLAATPELARTIASAYVDAYRAFNLNRSRADVSAIREFVGSQMAVVGARLDSTERRLESYKRAHRVADITEETKAIVARQTQVLAQLEQTRAEQEGVAHEVEYLNSVVDSSADIANTSSPLVSDLRSELSRLEAERANLLMQGFAAGSPRVVALGEKLGAVRAQITQQYSQFASPAGAIDGVSRVQGHFSRIAELQPELVRLRAATAALTSVALAYDGELRSIPTRERALARLTRDVEVDRQVHALLAQRYEEARIQEAGRLSTVGLVDEPRLGVRVRPNYRNDAVMALLLGLLLAFGTVFAVDYFDTTVRRPEDLERQGFSVLASVPRIETETGTARACAAGRQAGRPALVGTASGFPISGREPDSTVAEAFRVLRTNLQFGFAAQRGKQGLSGAARSYGGEATSDAGSPGNCPQFPERGAVSVIVTSPGAGEGKSLVASNLATVMAQSGKRTLLVDCDLRRPKQHKLFERRKKPGLTDVVMLGTPLEAALFSASSMPDASGIMPDGDEKGAGCLERQAASALHVIFAGTTPPSPVDFLNSSAFESFLKQAAGRYDCVVIDTPPVLVSADAAVLASKATGVVLVARMRTTDWRALAEAKKLLAQAGARVLGVVANELRLSRGYGYYRYKYRYYNYRYQTHNA